MRARAAAALLALGACSGGEADSLLLIDVERGPELRASVAQVQAHVTAHPQRRAEAAGDAPQRLGLYLPPSVRGDVIVVAVGLSEAGAAIAEGSAMTKVSPGATARATIDLRPIVFGSGRDAGLAAEDARPRGDGGPAPPDAISSAPDAAPPASDALGLPDSAAAPAPDGARPILPTPTGLDARADATPPADARPRDGGPSATTCCSLAQQYERAVRDGKTFRAVLCGANRCTTRVAASLVCGCSTFVDDPTAALDVRTRWTQAGCTKELCEASMRCPATTPCEPRSSRCAGDDALLDRVCVDQ